MKFKAGDSVFVRGVPEIVATLDGSGTLDGLPFMPEMLRYCGKKATVLRGVEKVCVEYPGLKYKMREPRNNDVVLLDIERCSGEDHDGCRRACTLLWKTAWLEKDNGNKIRPDEAPGPRPELRTKSGPDTYFCQSTQLSEATIPLSRPRVLLKCWFDYISGNRSASYLLKAIVVPIWDMAIWLLVPASLRKKIPVGSLTKTPLGNLNLQPGELVRIRTEAQIVETLDTRGLNRGLSCDAGMRQFCGGEYRVKGRLDRMISESTGRMRTVSGTVLLEGLECLCAYHVGGCPRADYMYWREIWLDRVETNATKPEFKANLAREAEGDLK